MAELLTKRGFTVTFVGWVEEDDIKISALLYSKPMTGGLMMKINSGPVSTDDAYLLDFYRALQIYAKEQGALELRFKQNFNGYITRKPGSFRYYPNPVKYKSIQLLKRMINR